MVPAIVTITVAVFLIVSFIVEGIGEALRVQRQRRLRVRALRVAEASTGPQPNTSVCRVELDESLATVLVVGSSRETLNSMRQILVLAGYSVDTVETADEARSILCGGSHDLVYLEVDDQDATGLLHLARSQKPPPEVIAMRVGGSGLRDLPESSFASPTGLVRGRRLIARTRRALVERARRLAAAQPTVRLVTADTEESDAKNVINVPAGLFIAQNHTWVGIQPNGEVRVGLDDFALKLLTSAVDDVELPLPNDQAAKTTPLFSLYRGVQSFEITSPIEGRVTSINDAWHRDAADLCSAPYTKGWICTLKAQNLSTELRALRLGEDAMSWYVEEIERHLGGGSRVEQN